MSSGLSNSEKKARAAISQFLDEKEEILFWIMGQTSPAEWMGFVPGLSIHYKLNVRGWVVVLTPYRILLLESNAALSWKLSFAQDCDLLGVRHLAFKSGFWTNRLILDLGHGPIVLKEVDAEETRSLLKAYKDAKKAFKESLKS